MFTVLGENTVMNIHRKTKLTPFHREEIWRLHHQEKFTVTYLAERFMVSRPTIYKVLKQGRLNLFVPLASKNERYRTIKYGIKRLAKIEKSIEEKLKKRAKRYNKNYPARWSMWILNGSLF
ncbi:HTH domain-containing protein [Ignatzschineria rhizosphaerae]|uniref:HTH domain-containing protein n=1 Tax=Ignatzschineria rhizosphaerae TaxID=2923279 RepID=A0ABY3X247_9GAMM|nr:HTH domain-containing protein [Ignatzschineria rhizosphaerae]UNM96958.1 HTH domain-containing protein [Ignatzschineria rhizosphaerae]